MIPHNLLVNLAYIFDLFNDMGNYFIYFLFIYLFKIKHFKY